MFSSKKGSYSCRLVRKCTQFKSKKPLDHFLRNNLRFVSSKTLCSKSEVTLCCILCSLSFTTSTTQHRHLEKYNNHEKQSDKGKVQKVNTLHFQIIPPVRLFFIRIGMHFLSYLEVYPLKFCFMELLCHTAILK